MYYSRFIETKLRQLTTQFPVVLLTGARQTGKTTTLKRMFPRHAFVALDMPSLGERAETQPSAFLAERPRPLIIDEVQYAPGLFRHLKVEVDRSPHNKGQFILTGSQHFNLMEGVSESLAGRTGICELETCGYHEIAEEQQGLDVGDFILRGGFPELWRDQTVDRVEYYRAYLATYIERDVRQLLNIRSLRDFERFIRALAARNGTLLNRTEVARDVGVAVTTIGDWISVLQASGQIVLLEPYFRNIGKRIVKTPKVYFADTGLLCFLLGLNPSGLSANGSLYGTIYETFVIGEIRRRLQQTSRAASLWFYRDRQGLEVDLLIDCDGALTPVEIKFAEQPTNHHVRNLRRFARLGGNISLRPPLLACNTPQDYLLDDVRVVNAHRFDEWFA